MAHDPTRHWPLGVGPENTNIPGAAWLELLDGQAFPVVGAGAMVWNGTMWVPVSTQNRLPVEATLSGRTAPEIETIINAQSVPASGNTGFVQVDFKGCRKAILGVICDKKWRLHTNALWSNVPNAGLHIYPDVSASDQEPVPFNYPREIVVGFRLGQSGAGITSLAQALQMAELPNNLRIQVQNRSEETMTVTVKLMRIW